MIGNEAERIEIIRIIPKYNFFDVLTLWNVPVYGCSGIVAIWDSIVNAVTVFADHLKVIWIG